MWWKEVVNPWVKDLVKIDACWRFIEGVGYILVEEEVSQGL